MNEKVIRDLEEQRYAAMLAANVTALEELLDDALTYTHSSGVVDTKPSYIGGVRDKVWEYKNISRENERVVIRGSCGLVFCRLKIDLNVRGIPNTAARHRGRGVGVAILKHIVAEARARGYRRLSLETGSMAAFAPARALYAGFGFTACAPFDTYKPDPNSVFMTLDLATS